MVIGFEIFLKNRKFHIRLCNMAKDNDSFVGGLLLWITFLTENWTVVGRWLKAFQWASQSMFWRVSCVHQYFSLRYVTRGVSTLHQNHKVLNLDTLVQDLGFESFDVWVGAVGIEYTLILCGFNTLFCNRNQCYAHDKKLCYYIIYANNYFFELFDCQVRPPQHVVGHPLGSEQSTASSGPSSPTALRHSASWV